MNTKKIKNNLTILIIMILSALVLLFSNNTFKAVGPKTITISTAAAFTNYSKAYYNGVDTVTYDDSTVAVPSADDIIVISITGGNSIVDGEFISLGTESKPFAGELQVPYSGVDTFKLFNCPIFDYVTTDFTIGGAGTVKISRQVASESPAANVLTSGSLFANHVVAGTNSASWSIDFVPYSGDSDEASTFECVFGEIATGATVSVNFNNTASLDVERSDNAGLICGTLKSSAILNVTTAGSASGLTVTSTTGDAGGLVGKMEAGSTLQFDSANNTGVTTVTSSTNAAGGIVGSLTDATLQFKAGITDYTVSGTVNARTSAGGLIGYYKNTLASDSLTLEKYTITSGMTISGTTNSGGVIGYLNNSGALFAFDGDKANKTITVNLYGPNSNSRGGVIGYYNGNAIGNTLTITNTSLNLTVGSGAYTGGVIGQITSASYVSISEIVCSATNTIGGGLVGTGGSDGPFIDVSGNITITGAGKYGAGLVNELPSGVLRIQGTTDLTSCKLDTYSARIVRSRGRSLVYALGSGNGSGWTLKRTTNTGDGYGSLNNDVGSWGEVLRVDGSILDEGDLFSISNHVLTVGAAATTINNITDFALTALNIQLNTGSGVGALQFTSGSANSSSTLLGGTITLGANIDLSGTGLYSFTRDDGANAAFTGTFNGASKTITFNTGETYGVNSSGTAFTNSDNYHYGNINSVGINKDEKESHKYIGLFAKTGSGASVSNLTLSGNYDLIVGGDNSRLGGFAAYSTGTMTVTNVTIDFSVDMFKNTSTSFTAHYGGLIGQAHDDLAITITGSNINPHITDTTSAKSGNGPLCFGGVIGRVSYNGSQSISISSSTVGLDYEKTIDAQNYQTAFGAIIAKIDSGDFVSTRTVTLGTGLIVNIDATSRPLNDVFGGIFGCEWLACNVTVNGVTINSASIVALPNSPAANYGGLVQTATGYWDIQDITVTSANFKLPNATSFGFVANKTFASSCALYLEVDNTSTHYNIGAVTFTSPSFTYFDEIVADSRSAGDIVSNGNSVISIKTTGNIISTTSSTYNTYHNKTAYGKATGFTNPNTRYYYNVAHAVSLCGASDKYNFFTWSVKTYAHSSIKSKFGSPTSIFTGDLDMTGLSYYPVDLSGSVSFTSAVIKLDNNLMEDYVKWAYYDDASNNNSTRTTRSASQHYLMHTAIFRDVIGSVTFTGTNKIQGNVPKISNSFVGFLVSGTLGGHNTTDTSLSITGLELDGVYVSNAGANFTTNTYAPLLVNNAGKKTSITINNLKQSTSAYTSYNASEYYAASSLIGDVGDTSASAINIAFTGITLDGRSTATSLGNMDTTYGTYKSIFSRATLLNSFVFDTDSSGTYNFEKTEDWPSSTATHKVTYGYEIKSSTEYSNKQKKYFTSGFFVSPTTFEAGSEYNFSTGFLRYVYVAYNLGDKTHELKVNQSENTTIEGCGKENDPFVVDGDQLAIISEIINGIDVGSTVQLYLPTETNSSLTTNWTSTNYTKNLYSAGNPNFTSSNGGADRAKDLVRKYLAGAYYKISGTQTLPSDYISLGTVTSKEYAFHGVIEGVIAADVKPTITNTSPNPLVYTSTGCVIKDVDIIVDVDYNDSPDISLASPLAADTFQLSGGAPAYGALIRQVLGGDTFIDNVEVTFNGVNFVFTGNGVSNHYERLIPIGGYIGVLVNGGVIFRNMDSDYEGLTNAKCNKIDNDGYLYVNPIIGRVIAGYAFHEATSFSVVSDYVDNGDKNYEISDLVVPASDSSKLDVTYSSSTYTINVPNGQSLFILGALVNSGAASATQNASTEQAYDALSGPWQGYSEYTECRDGASDANNTYNNSRVNVPYIVRVYTKKVGNVYPARSMTSAQCNINITADCVVPAGFRGIGSFYISNSKTRILVQQFNGNNHTITLRMKYQEYDHNLVGSSTYISSKTSNFGTDAGFGLFNRLYTTNQNLTNNPSNSINNFILSGSIFYDVYTVNNGAQSDYSFGAGKDRNDFANFTGIRKTTHLSVGGIAGIFNFTDKNNNFNIKDVRFNGFEVDGAKYAGGYIGFVYNSLSNSNLTTTNSAITFSDSITSFPGYLSVAGGLAAGGFIGRSYSSNKSYNLSITSAYSGKTDIKIKEIVMKSTSPKEEGGTYKNNSEVGAGGLIGVWYARADGSKVSFTDETGATVQSHNALKLITISNIKLSKDTIGSIRVHNCEAITANLFRFQSNYAGGIIGAFSFGHLIIDNVELNDIDVNATIAGGIVGRVSQGCFADLTNVLLDGNSQSGSISGTRFAGGIFGIFECRDEAYYAISNTTITDYVIEATATADCESAAGGFVGVVGGPGDGNSPGGGNGGSNVKITDTQSRILLICNSTISGCLIKTNYTSSNTLSSYVGCQNSGTGGIIGSTFTNDFADKKFKICGYNIYLDGNSIKHYEAGANDYSVWNGTGSNKRIGEIIGNNKCLSPVKFVGISIDNTTSTGRLCGLYNGTGEAYGSSSNSYWTTGVVVLSNYYSTTDVGQDSNYRSIKPTGATFTDVSFETPYMTINPVATIGGLKITSDGFQLSKDDLQALINSIKAPGANANTPPSFYYTNATAYYNGSNGTSNVDTIDLSKVIMFNTEETDYLGTNFPVIMIENMTDDAINKLINSYIRVLTNTNYDYGGDLNYYYSVDIYKLAYENGSFVDSTSGVSLSRKNGSFHMSEALFDSGKQQFSLIDVRFLNPADTTTVAYHFYVPVYIKKVLTYQFDIALQSGTTYLEDEYTDKYGQALIENTGTPVTFFFKYSYDRTAAEWESAINGGEKAYRFYEKTLYFENHGIDLFPSDAILVLVDKNRGGTPYYAPASAINNGELPLSAFKTTMTYDGSTYTFSGESFTPLAFSEFFTITATADAAGKLVQCLSSDPNLTLMIGSQGYRYATDEEIADNEVTKYSVTVSGDDVEESYYLSVFTKSNLVNDALFHYFIVTAASRLTDGTYPAKIKDTLDHTMVHLVMGKIFYHDGYTIRTSSTPIGGELMTDTNNTLNVAMKVELGINSSLSAGLKSDLRSMFTSVSVYQSFLIYLSRKENGEITKAIIGNPTGSGSYTIDTTINGTADGDSTSYPNAKIRINQNFAEFVSPDLKSYFTAGNNFEIISNLSLTYTPSGIIAQFPGRNENQKDNGVSVSGSSNISFNESLTSSSKNRIGADENPEQSYYSEAEPEAATLDLNPIGDTLGDFSPLGINALNNDGSPTKEFDLLAVLDANPIRDLIVGYTDAFIKIELCQKGNSGYGAPLDISEYLTVSFDGILTPVTDNGNYYSIVVSSANLSDNGVEITMPVIHCTVLTGEALEAKSEYYSNYEINVTVELRNSLGNAYAPSIASNYVIYTNAKILPTYIDR